MSEPRTLFPVGRTDVGKRLDRFLRERMPRLSRTRIQEMIRTRVFLSWEARVRPATVLVPGGEIRIAFRPIPETLLEIPIPVLERGDGWMAVDKPAGLPVHPHSKVRENTVIRMIRRQEGIESLTLTHRLDRETSGVLLLADNPETAALFAKAFEARQVHKEYLAVVEGVLDQDRGSIDLPVGKALHSRLFVRQGTESGKEALTSWQVERRGESKTLLRLFPHTGRRHQIRVHLEAIGHPVVGDMLYGRSDEDFLNKVKRETDRHLLHCARIRVEGARPVVDCSAPTPPDFLDRCGFRNR